MRGISYRKGMLASLLIVMAVLYFCLPKAASADDGWKVTLYEAQLTPDSLGDTLALKGHYVDSHVVVLAASKRVYSFKKLVDLEMEGQVAKHFGIQDHLEVNVVPLVVRWLPFPWDSIIDTSIAAGAGLSYAFETPVVELFGVSHTPKFLGYLMCEISLSLPSLPRWAVVARLHHRSGAGGLFAGRRDASNGLGFGAQFNF